MLTEADIIKLLFGFKLKYLRQNKGLSLEELATQSGLSKSYIHDLEKGKKYPKVAKISTLANALEVEYDYLVSRRASKRMQPVVDLLTSDLLKEFPLGEFGVSTDKLVELLANTPEKVNAFIETIMNITRHYQLDREHLYFTALRSYQNLHDNYFPELEEAASTCCKALNIPSGQRLSLHILEDLLKKVYAISIDREQLSQQLDSENCRSYYAANKKVIFLRKGLSTAQERFILCRELGFQYLGLNPRPYETRILEVADFETLLNNFRASYFASALVMNEEEMIRDIEIWSNENIWNPNALSAILNKYEATPEMLLQRLTNLLPHHFGLSDLFFIRLQAPENLNHYRMTKELHLSRLHSPYANALNEHYCRRWVSVNIIKQARHTKQKDILIQAQVSQYPDIASPHYGRRSEASYLCLSMARTQANSEGAYSSVTLGLQVNEPLRARFRFLSDPNLATRVVNTTCERCSISDCEARVCPASALEEKTSSQKTLELLRMLDY
ncbi:MAG: helix-turn-helix domain-containing protein [Chitinophagales bacterium]|nr:helix-turn-helix domain-containing protein [Chitinophagales bacterium]